LKSLCRREVCFHRLYAAGMFASTGTPFTGTATIIAKTNDNGAAI
jgi:hypothetical protein